VAQIEVTEESIRGLVDGELYERGVLLASQVSGLSVSGAVVEATADGMRVTARILPNRLGGECECADSVPCGHVVATLLAWVWSTAPADEASSLLADFEDALAEEKLDVELLDELADDLEDLLDAEPAAARDVADRVMNLFEARDDADVPDLADLLERIEELYLEAREVAGSDLSVSWYLRRTYAVTRARMLSRSEPMVASTALGSYPQWAMQLAQRGSLPRPNASQSVVSSSSEYVFA
jgi:hypothetical protein